MFKNFLLNRLKEPSTYVGVVAILAGAFGLALSDENALAIASGVATVIGTLLAAHREKKSDDSPVALRKEADDASFNPAAGGVQPHDVPPESDGKPGGLPIGGARDVHRNRNKQ